MTETTSPARLIQSLTVIAGSSVVNREKDKGRATLVLFLGETTCGAERDLGARAVFLRLAISNLPSARQATYLYAFPHRRRALPPACVNRATAGPGRFAAATLPSQPAGTGSAPRPATGRTCCTRGSRTRPASPALTMHRPEPGQPTLQGICEPTTRGMSAHVRAASGAHT
jgi:hypothetical protein